MAEASDHANNEPISSSSSSSANRRGLFSQAIAATAAVTGLSSAPSLALAAASDAPPITRLSASWSATSGLNALDPKDPNFVAFDASSYAAMRDDPSRTPMFRKALQARLSKSPPLSQLVLDLGTGPFALFAVMAAELGAKHVYAIEANPLVAENARRVIRKEGWEDVITVLEGFTTDITLPNQEKADIIVAEIVGSIASEEGAFATILDAHQRLIKNPTDPDNWIPNRIQTWAAPASYTLHNLFQPPEFDWTKIATEPVRFNCRDVNLGLLGEPQLLEDIFFSELKSGTPTTTRKKLTFTVSNDRMQQNAVNFVDEYKKGRLPNLQATTLAETAAHSCTGIAMWPRLFLPGNIVIQSRSHPYGGPQKSHWQTVLPIMAATPAGGLKGGDTIQVATQFETPASVQAVSKYSITADILRGSREA